MSQPFFDNLNGKQQAKSSKGRTFAIQLSKILKRHGKLKRHSIHKWEKEFGQLEKKVGFQRIQNVLKWYDVHLKSPYVPQAFSGGSFHRKFERLEEAMERQQGPTPKNTENRRRAIEIVLGQVDPLGWAWMSLDTLCSTISVCLERYDEWVRRFYDAKAHLTPDQSRLQSFADYVSRQLPSATSLVVDWLKYIHGVSPYGTEPGRAVWDAGSNWWNGIGRVWSVQYCGRPKLWIQLVDEVIDESGTTGCE